MKILDKIVVDKMPPLSPYVLWLKVRGSDQIGLFAFINGSWVSLNASSSEILAELHRIEELIPDEANVYNKLADKDYVGAEIARVQRIGFEIVPVLPPASADTMLKIYLVPSTNPKFQNSKDEYVTIQNITEGGYYYAWEQIGSTAMQLSTISNEEIDALFT